VTVAERYLRLGLRLDRHVEGTVDAYFGPPELKAEVDAEPPVAPQDLAADAAALLDETGDGWLRDQLVGLHTYARALAGDVGSYADEVEGCYGVRPAYTDETVFEEAHRRLDALLPGDGPLGERVERWEASTRVPPELVERTIGAVIDEARVQTRRVVELPEGEDVELALVRDVGWLAFCEYLGDFRSRIQVNVDLPISGIEALVLAMHETYPGHHAERCAKDQLLVRGRGLLEETIVLVPTPQSLVAEGIAKLGPRLLLEGVEAPALAEIVANAGVELDLPLALEIGSAREPLGGADVNAAILLHERGASEAEVHDYLRRWSLLTPELATHVVRFLGEPTSRTYILTYSAGRDLCRAYVGEEPERFRRLLTEQVRVGELLAARDGTSA